MKLMGLILLVTVSMGLSAMTDAEFLEYVKDDSRFAPVFKADMTFDIFTPGGEPGQAQFVLYENQGKSIAMFQAPARDKGKVVLQAEKRYWMYFPRSKSVTVLSPMASVAGNASNADVLRPPASSLYDITLIDMDDKKGGDRVVQLIANSRKSPYGKIIRYYDNTKPVFAEIYSRSGILLKTAKYENHRKNSDNQGWISMKTTIVDGSNKDKYTVITFLNLNALNRIDENWYNPNNLSRVRP